MESLPLKAKYLDPLRRGPKGQVAKRREKNSHPGVRYKKHKRQGVGNRRRVAFGYTHYYFIG